MSDFSHWDWAVEFSGYEIGALILGVEPRESEDDERRVKVIAERVAHDFSAAVARMESELNSAANGYPSDCIKWRAGELPSTSLSAFWKPKDAVDASRILTDFRRTRFPSGMQNFSRDSVVQWLRSNAMESKYRFDRTEPVSRHEPTRWPWGNHHTEALGHLDAAARKWWINYDPNDAGTAPTNDEVSAWLQSERGLSKQKADSIASILRADGLPAGPRR